MADALVMDRMFQRIMRGLVDTGRASHHAELARALGLGGEEGRLLLRDVMRAYPIGWLHQSRTVRGPGERLPSPLREPVPSTGVDGVGSARGHPAARHGHRRRTA